MLKSDLLELENGLRIVTIPQPHLHSASLAFYARCGSRYENLEHWGLSHLLEHMLFKGSQTYPDSRQLNEVFEGSGSMLEAATWRDHTSFSASLHPTYLQTALKALADMVTHPLLNDLDTERRVVLEELNNELDDQDEDSDPHNISRSFIWQDHPLGRRITGSVQTLESFTTDHLQQHHQQHYIGSNSVLCLAGRLPEDIEKHAAEYFSQMPQGVFNFDKTPAVFSPIQTLALRERRSAQLSVQLTFDSLPYGHADFTALELLTRILDGGISSRLHQSVCDKQGLVYEMDTELDCYTDCGVYDITLKVAPKRAHLAIEAILQTLQELCEKGVSKHELAEAKKQSLHAIEFRVDSPLEVADQYGCSALFDTLDTLEKEAKRLSKVTSDDVLRVAKKMFAEQRLHATLVGPIARTQIENIETLIRNF